MFCFQIHALAYCTMNSKFSILHEAKLSAVLKISSSLYSKQVRVFENKTRTNSLSLTLLIFNLSSLLASRPNTVQFLSVIVITHSVTLMSPGNANSRDQF